MNLEKANQKIIKKIKLLAEIKPRGEWKNSFRDILISEIKLTSRLPVKTRLNVIDYISIFSQSVKVQVFQPAVGILLIIAVFLGSSLLVNAAFYSLPGDNLYDLKIALEKTQVSLIFNDEKKAELRMEFIKNRVEEFEKIANLRPQDLQQKTIAQITESFKNDVQSINEHMVSLDLAKKPVFSLAKSFDEKTSALAKTLAVSKNKLPENVKSQVEDAVNEAVATANTASDSAFRIALNKAEAEGAQDFEVAALVIGKIGSLEQELAEIKDGELLITAQEVVAQAKVLVESGKIEEAAEKITQIQALISQIENQPVQTENLNLEENQEVLAEAENQAIDVSAGQVLGQATSTEETDKESTFLETTQDIIK